MIGLLLAAVIFGLCLSRLTVYMRGRYECAEYKWDRDAIRIETAGCIVMLAMASLVVGHLFSVAPWTLLIPVLGYAAYRGFNWWFHNKIAK